MSIHVVKVRPSIHFIEDDRYRNFALNASDYLFLGGQRHAPEWPGWEMEE